MITPIHRIEQKSPKSSGSSIETGRSGYIEPIAQCLSRHTVKVERREKVGIALVLLVGSMASVKALRIVYLDRKCPVLDRDTCTDRSERSIGQLDGDFGRGRLDVVDRVRVGRVVLFVRRAGHVGGWE